MRTKGAFLSYISVEKQIRKTQAKTAKTIGKRNLSANEATTDYIVVENKANALQLA